MPPRRRTFEFHFPDEPVFKCPLQGQRCRFSKPKGGLCQRTVVNNVPMCWQHTKTNLWLRACNSRIAPGTTGLMAVANGMGNPVFKKGEFIVCMSHAFKRDESNTFVPHRPLASGLPRAVGEVLTQAQLDERYTPGDHFSGYAVHMGPDSQGLYLDHACMRGIGSQPNTCSKPPMRGRRRQKTYPNMCNSDIIATDATQFGVVTVWIEATKDIKAGDEIITSYSKGQYFDPSKPDYVTHSGAQRKVSACPPV